MIFHENRLLADKSYELVYLFFSKIRKDVAKFVVCCSRGWRFKGPFTPAVLTYVYVLDVYVKTCV